VPAVGDASVVEREVEEIGTIFGRQHDSVRSKARCVAGWNVKVTLQGWNKGET